MRWIATLIPALVASSATALTVYDDFADWQAAVGSYAVEDFETYPETLFPLEGGQIVLDELILEADAQGDHEWAGMSGLRLASFWPGKPDTMGFLSSLESYDGATYNHIIFPQPIRALFLDVTWTEDGWLGVDFGEEGVYSLEYFEPGEPFSGGFVLDAPQQTIGIECDHTWCHVDAVYWQVVPEPATAALVGLGLLGLAARRRERAGQSRPGSR